MISRDLFLLTVKSCIISYELTSVYTEPLLSSHMDDMKYAHSPEKEICLNIWPMSTFENDKLVQRNGEFVKFKP